MTDARRKPKSNPAGSGDTLTAEKKPSRKVAKKVAKEVADEAIAAAAAATASVPQLAPVVRGRLEGKVAFVTGAGGNIGADITRRYLEEGASVVMVGRDMKKLEATRARLLQETCSADGRAITLPMDGADAVQVHAAIAAAVAAYGRLDIIVNNAGSSGPKQRLEHMPLTDEDLQAQHAEGSPSGILDNETALSAAKNLLGMAWTVTRTALPYLKPGAAIINVTTIFSRTEYFGRAPYVVPKAAFNALSRNLASELGPRGIRVNTVLPGPIDSDRIRNVFAAMDKLRHGTRGTTAREFIDLMTLARDQGSGAPEFGLPSIRDVANAIVFLASDEAAAFNGHEFEVTNGMTVRRGSHSTWVSRPELRTVDGTGCRVLLAAGEQLADALAIARVQSNLGAEVLLGLPTEELVKQATGILDPTPEDQRITPVLLDRMQPQSVRAVLGREAGNGRLNGAIIMPAAGPHALRGPLAHVTDAEIELFIEREVIGALALARELSRFWHTQSGLEQMARVVFVTNGDDGAGNVVADMLRAAVEELIRVWRQESAAEMREGEPGVVQWGNQIIRYTNSESEGLPFAAGQIARLLFTERRIQQINLYLPASIQQATGARRAAMGAMETLHGLHKGKVALITGGSSGIGGQIGRLLAAAGARVMLVARGAEALQTMRDRIVGELEDSGYWGARRRVQMLAGVDVGNLASIENAVNVTVDTFGRVDYLINCAGVAGAEEMVVDMGLDAWRYTLDANLISNYALIQRVIPLMKKQGSGYIVNVSSYFGGEKYVATPYPNRSDYAVSKAGQRALAESLARFIGPEIQINAVSPGPVEGERLKGKGGKAGLFERRGKLILENRRLNAVYAAVVRGVRAGERVDEMLQWLASNSMDTLLEADAPATLQRLAQQLAAEKADNASWDRYPLTASIAAKLTARLKRAGYFLNEADRGALYGKSWADKLPEAPEPFLPPSLVKKEAAKIADGVISLLHMKRMPTEHEVALATVYFLADRAVSGETFLPSGGLSLERSITERELFGSVKRERVEMMRGRTVWMIGEHLVQHLARAASVFATQAQVGKIMLLTKTKAAAAAVVEQLSPSEAAVTRVIVCGDDLETGMDQALREGGRPTSVISTPFAPLPEHLEDGAGQWLDTAGFKAVVESNITHHFRVARKAALYDDVNLMLVSPDVPVGSTPEPFALANFIKSTLHAFTGTLAVECERLVHDAVVNQINLTRRVRSEEPRNAEETEEELDRFGRAVLLAGAPLPKLEDSRYRSRIYRGMAITV
jgi:malonyl-CoA reductase/3-hydroxypropionate dehydrogenase (NADP+)